MFLRSPMEVRGLFGKIAKLWRVSGMSRNASGGFAVSPNGSGVFGKCAERARKARGDLRKARGRSAESVRAGPNCAGSVRKARCVFGNCAGGARSLRMGRESPGIFREFPGNFAGARSGGPRASVREVFGKCAGHQAGSQIARGVCDGAPNIGKFAECVRGVCRKYAEGARGAFG